MMSWIVKDNNDNIAGFRIHQFDLRSIERITHHLVMPLLGAHQILYKAFHARMKKSIEVQSKWNLGRPFELIKEEFPDLWFILTDEEE